MRKGFTILEIALSLVLTLILGASFYAVHKKKIAADVLLTCDQDRWSWMQALDVMEWELRKWEVLAGPCLKAGFSPIEISNNGSKVTLTKVISVRPVLLNYSSSSVLGVSSQNDFLPEDTFLLCSPEKARKGKIQQVAAKDGQYTNITPQYETEDEQAEATQIGTLVVTTKTITYRSAPSELPPKSILYEMRTETDQSPISTNFEKFLFEAHVKDESQTEYRIEFSSENCKLEDQFSVYSSSVQENVGLWWLRNNNLVLDRWVFPEGVERP